MPATMKGLMKAVRIHEYGGPEVLQLEEVPVPEPGEGQVLVRVRAAGVNPIDWKLRQGYRSVPLPETMGIDFSGVIEAIGSGVTEFAAGDEVCGEIADESGSYAEYALAEAAHIAAKPPTLDFILAAALPLASLTAWQALFDSASVKRGDRVLIHAAAGGVGGFAVQLAKWKGAYVVGTASGQSIEFVKTLGADEVIDYTTTPFEERLRDIDMVLDTIGGQTQERSFQVLKPNGILVSLVQPPSQEKAAAQGVCAVIMRQKANGQELKQILALVTGGKIKIPVQTILPLEEARKAHEMSQSGHTRGKIVLVVA
jgi:NADPH:quinone reductase-like Zn-dependent oxidoreductase